MSETASPILSGTCPSDVLLKNPELHCSNVTASLPAPFKPAPWWQCLFVRWGEPEFVKVVKWTYQYWWSSGASTGPIVKHGSLYRQIHRRTGKARYFVDGHGRVDTGAWEHEKRLVWL